MCVCKCVCVFNKSLLLTLSLCVPRYENMFETCIMRYVTKRDLYSGQVQHYKHFLGYYQLHTTDQTLTQLLTLPDGDVIFSLAAKYGNARDVMETLCDFVDESGDPALATHYLGMGTVWIDATL